MNYLTILKLFIVSLFASMVATAQEVSFLQLISDSVVHVSETDKVVILSFQVEGGFHIQSNRPLDDSVIATELTIEWPRGVTAYEPIFPKAKALVLEGTTEPLEVFSDLVEVRVAINFEENKIKGKYRIPGAITYQACDHMRCFFPRKLSFDFDIVIN